MTELSLSKRILLHLRYVSGYLAAAFVAAAFLQMTRGEGSPRLFLALLLYAGGFTLLFFILLPVSRLDWTKVRLPAFKRFELAVARDVCLAAVAILLYAWFGMLPGIDGTAGWSVFVLTAFTFLQLKLHSYLFREFYEAGLRPTCPEPEDAERVTGGAGSTSRLERGEKEGSRE